MLTPMTGYNHKRGLLRSSAFRPHQADSRVQQRRARERQFWAPRFATLWDTSSLPPLLKSPMETRASINRRFYE